MTDRYSRQVLFRGIGQAGQERIGASAVTVIGCGALGTVSSEMLVRAGVGRVRIVDRDFVEESNLARQTLFTEEDAAEALPKAPAAARALVRVNSEVEIEGVVADVTASNVGRLTADCDLIVDGTDNFETRFLINDLAVSRDLPWVYGGAVSSHGIAAAIRPHVTPCLRCLFPAPPPAGETETCDTAGVVAPVIHAVAAFQVAAALKLMVGEEVPADILQVDVWSNDWRVIRGASQPQADCECCGRGLFPYLEGEQQSRLTRLCGRNAVQVYPPKGRGVDLEAVARRLAGSVRVRTNPHLLRAWVDDCEIALFADGRAIVKGTEDSKEAKAIYARYVGA